MRKGDLEDKLSCKLGEKSLSQLFLCHSLSLVSDGGLFICQGIRAFCASLYSYEKIMTFWWEDPSIAKKYILEALQSQ